MIKYSLSIFLISLLSINLIGQDLVNSRTSSPFTYIYKITNTEAKRLYEKTVDEVNDSYFHSRIDSFSTDSTYRKQLGVGHYLFLYTEGSQFNVRLESINNVDIRLINNKKDLQIIAYDSVGVQIHDALFLVGRKRIKFNALTGTYITKKSNNHGLASILHNNHWNYFAINRRYNNTLLARTGRRIKYSPPIKYLWMPFRDIYRSIRYGYPQGFIEKIVRWFDPYNREDNYSKKFSGYISFNKPKYKPGDTVKLKAFVVDKNYRPINYELILRVGNYGNGYKSIALIKPNKKGSYIYEFVLHDSLDFQLDRTQQVLLEKKESKTVIQSGFQFEDYELKSTSYSLRSDDKNNHIGHSMILYMKGVDENEMNLLDARVDLTILSKPLLSYNNDRVFVPDTLWSYQQNLDPLGETKLVIPDSIFPPVDLKYTVNAHFLNSNNEFHLEHLDLNYTYAKEQFQFELKNDSLYINYLVAGKSLAHQASFSGDSENDELFEQNIQLPFKTVIDPYVSDYYVSDGKQGKFFNMFKEEDGITILTDRTIDSVFIELGNSRKIPVWYTIYAGKNELERGYTHSALSFKCKATTSKPYFISYHYLWANKINEEEQSIPYFDKQLRITVDQPKSVFPGQKVEFSINVKDSEENPVSDVDLTAYAFTKKFKYADVPEVPYMGKVFVGRSTFNYFNNYQLRVTSAFSDLEWENWSKKLGLDSIEYYKFLYPSEKIYWNHIATSDSSTQFAPFVVNNGKTNRIHVIYLDNTPIYYSGVNALSNYSFVVDSENFHSVKLRLANKIIEIDSLVFKKGFKSIFSFSNNISDRKVHIKDAPSFLTTQEKRELKWYFILINDNFNNSYAYLKQDDNVQLLNTNNNSWNRNSKILAGPFFSDSAKFVLMDNYSTDFIYESGYEYNFHERLLKMRYQNEFPQFNKYLIRDYSGSGFGQFALTEADVKEKWQFYLDGKFKNQKKYDNPSYTSSGNSKLYYQLSDSIKLTDILIENIVLLNEEDPNFLRIYKSNERVIYDLPPGTYKLIFLLSTNEYFTIDSVGIKKNGSQYLTIANPQISHNDNYIENILKIISANQLQSNFIRGELDKDIRQIKQLANRKYQQRNAFDNEITGRILSAEDGSALPGVNIVIKGTNIGTVSDIDGYYTIYVPNGGVLVYSFIGVATEEIQVGNRSTIDVQLSPDVKQLSEVVVTAMGIQRSKRSLGYSVSAINSLSGKAAGVSVGAASMINIRGNGSIIANNEALIIVDGTPYNGKQSDIDPSQILTIKVLKGEEAVALYGSQAIRGVIIITTSKLNRQLISNNTTFNDTQSAEHSMRSNFSDYAYWKPELVTDKNGNASFTVDFPDDITNWRTFVIGMDGKKHSGQMESSIKSFKSIISNLAVPQFMTNEDTINVIGKILNYTRDTLTVKTKFIVNDSVINSKERRVINSFIDSLNLNSSHHSDSIKVSYSMEQSNGYFDGEERTIPIYKVGVNETKGYFYTLDQDTTLNLVFDPLLGDVSVFANANSLDLLENEIEHVRDYAYLCNEQMASKLHAFLAEKRINAYNNEKFKYDKDVKSLIRKLQKNQLASGLWGWWKNSLSENWISNHVLEALFEARGQGYAVNIETAALEEGLKWNIENMNVSERIFALSTLNKLSSNIEFKGHIARLEKQVVSQNEYLKLLNLKSELGFEVKLDSLLTLKKETMIGNYYWDSNKELIYDNSFENTLLVYQLLNKVDTLKNVKSRIRAYLLENRNNGYWVNTYQSSRAINVLLPNELIKKNHEEKLRLVVNNNDIDSFPYEQNLIATDTLKLIKSGDLPIYITAHQRTWVEKPLAIEKDIVVKTYFNEGDILQTGSPTKLFVEVIMKKKADYLMIEVPIPAGCSYQNKSINYSKEEHREYYKNKTNIYVKSLAVGKHVFVIDLVPRYKGSFTLNPAKVELMYYPTHFGRNEIKRVKLK